MIYFNIHSFLFYFDKLPISTNIEGTVQENPRYPSLRDDLQQLLAINVFTMTPATIFPLQNYCEAKFRDCFSTGKYFSKYF